MAQLPDMTPDDAPRTLASVSEVVPDRLCECGCGLPLTGRQKRFASRVCCSRWWDAQHPRVNRGPEGPRKGAILHLILGVLGDGQWRTVHQIGEEIRAFPHSVSARLSELRRRGHRIETDAKNGDSTRAHRFRLVVE